MSSVIVLEWKFSPPDYFESPTEIEQDNYTMTIDNGKAEAKIDSEVYEANPLMRDALHKALNSRFLGVLLYSHKLYDLSRPTMIRVHDDGRIDRFLSVEPGRLKLTGGEVDFQITDKDGNVVVNTKQDRIERKKAIADMVSKHAADDIVLALLRSYEDSVREPNNELLYLYEIRDALYAKFGRKMQSILNISNSDWVWSWFGILCNNEPVQQGRHRGKRYSELRDATDDELSKARRFAQAMIKAYLHYLDSRLT